MCVAGNSWVSILAALLTLTIAVAGLIIAFFRWETNDFKRENELFDRRYEFYQRLRNWWLATLDRQFNEGTFEDLIPFAEETDFLFDPDILEHILSLEGKNHSGSPSFANEDFILPFRRYLKLR